MTSTRPASLPMIISGHTAESQILTRGQDSNHAQRCKNSRMRSQAHSETLAPFAMGFQSRAMVLLKLAKVLPPFIFASRECSIAIGYLNPCVSDLWSAIAFGRTSCPSPSFYLVARTENLCKSRLWRVVISRHRWKKSPVLRSRSLSKRIPIALP